MTKSDFGTLAPQLTSSIEAVLDASNASAELKLEAVRIALEWAIPLAQAQASQAAGGDFLAFLAKLIELLLPLILKLLGLRTSAIV